MSPPMFISMFNLSLFVAVFLSSFLYVSPSLLFVLLILSLSLPFYVSLVVVSPPSMRASDSSNRLHSECMFRRDHLRHAFSFSPAQVPKTERERIPQTYVYKSDYGLRSSTGFSMVHCLAEASLGTRPQCLLSLSPPSRSPSLILPCHALELRHQEATKKHETDDPRMMHREAERWHSRLSLGWTAAARRVVPMVGPVRLSPAGRRVAMALAALVDPGMARGGSSDWSRS